MTVSKSYMAAPVPRFLRQTKLGHLPLSCVIGSYHTQSGNGSHFIYDIVMLPVPQFQRMKTTMGLQHVVAPMLKAGPDFAPAFVLSNAKSVTVPPEEKDPEQYAKDFFLKEFNLLSPVPPPGHQE